VIDVTRSAAHAARRRGRTPLPLARARGYTEMIAILQAAGAR
jgi:hypothetical protein